MSLSRFCLGYSNPLVSVPQCEHAFEYIKNSTESAISWIWASKPDLLRFLWKFYPRLFKEFHCRALRGLKLVILGALVFLGTPSLSLSSPEGIHMYLSVCTCVWVRTYKCLKRCVSVNVSVGICVQCMFVVDFLSLLQHGYISLFVTKKTILSR